MQQALNWLEGHSKSGIYKVLKRLGVSRKQAINFIRNPDLEYRLQPLFLPTYASWMNPIEKL